MQALEKIKIGTRQSALALWQAEYVAMRLKEKYPSLAVELVKMKTKGDRILDAPLAKIGGKGLFTKELENAILSGEIDIAVHSLKDMPTAVPDGLIIACITERFDPGDAFVSNKYPSFADLPPKAVVGTSSLRRRAQLLALRSDLVIKDLRGNVNSRLAKLDAGEYDAIVLACAGLKRLGFSSRIAEVMGRDKILPAVGQGALAIEARKNDTVVLDVIKFLDDATTRCCTTCERAFLGRVEGGCQVPVGVYAEIFTAENITAEAVIASLDGSKIYRKRLSAPAAEAKKLGLELAENLLSIGGRSILQEIGLLESERTK